MSKTTFFQLLLLLFLSSCTVNDGQDGLNSLLLTSLEPAGTNCSTGGLRVDSGLDANSNGILDTSEILTTNYICAGVNSLINIVDELAGGNCPNGGIRIETGQDTNGNGTLDSEEILITRILCNTMGGGFDEQIRLDFGITVGAGTSSTDGIIVGEIPNFDKNFWVGVDSIVFATKIGYFPDPATSFAQIYNNTSNALVPKSLITHDEIYSDDMPFLYSGNFYDDLPDGEINLSIELRTGTEGHHANIGRRSYLFLYRSN